MDIVVFAVSVLALALALVALAVPAARRVGLPLPVAIAGAGLAAGTAAILADFSLSGTSLGALDRWIVEEVAFDSTALLHIFLPPLLFEMALSVNVRRLLEDIGGVILMAVVAVIAATVLVGLAVWAVTPIALTACLMLVHFTPLKAFLDDLDAIRRAVAETGLWAPATFFAIAMGSVFVGAPRLPFCVLAGMLFGFVQGLVLSQIATLLGAYGPFLFARHSSGDFLASRLKQIDRIAPYLEDPTVWSVFWIRQVPVWGLFTNLCLGSLGISHRTFVLGSILGFLPQAILFTLIGTGLVQESLLRALSQIWVAVPFLVIGAVWISRPAEPATGVDPPEPGD